MIIRNIKSADIISVLNIYAPFIANSTVTFENEIPNIDSFTNRIEHYVALFPWLVADVDGKISGYAYASKYRDREAYQWMVECSIYLDPDFAGKGIAKNLYNALFEILKIQGIYKVFAVIGLPNLKSVSFHEKMGFTWFATYKNVGYKLGKWLNVGWWELILSEPKDTPKTPIPYAKLNKNKIERILKKYSK